MSWSTGEDEIDARSFRIRSLARQAPAEAAAAWRALRSLDPGAAAALMDQLAGDAALSGGIDPLLAAAAETDALTPGARRAFDHRRALALADALAAEVGDRLFEAAEAYGRLAALEPAGAETAAGRARVVPALQARFETGEPPERAAAAALLAELSPDGDAAQRHWIDRAIEGEDWPEALRLLDRRLGRAGAGPAADTDAEDDLAVEMCGRAGRLTDALVSRHAGRGDRRGLRLRQINKDALAVALEAADWPAAERCLGWARDLGDPEAAAMLDSAVRRLRKTLQDLAPDDPARITVLRHLHRAAPADDAVMLRLGRLLMKDRAYEEAIPLWRRLAAARPAEVEPWLQLARSCRKLGQAEAALDACAKVLALDATHEEAGRYAEELRARLGF